jgi:hypothetical protein
MFQRFDTVHSESSVLCRSHPGLKQCGAMVAAIMYERSEHIMMTAFSPGLPAASAFPDAKIAESDFLDLTVSGNLWCNPG